jgi:hypothetical protein
MTTLSARFPRRAGLAAAATAALAVAAPAAGAAGLDPAIYDTGVPAGQVEHGTYAFTISGSAGNDQDRKIEYWISGTRWRDQTRDAQSGDLLYARVHDDTGTTWIDYHPPADRPPVIHFSGNDSVPSPGYRPAWNAKMLAGTLVLGNPGHEQHVTLQPLGPQTLAGLTGTRYEVLTNGKTGIDDPGAGGSHSYVTFEDGTNLPLARETTAPNGRYGTFDQKEELIARDTTGDDAALAQVSRLSFKKTVAKWKATVAKAKATKKKAKAKKHHRATKKRAKARAKKKARR